MRKHTDGSLSRRGIALGVTLAIAALAPAGVASAAVSQAPATDVAQALGAESGTYNGNVDPVQGGVGDAPLAGMPTAGGTFGVLSSGDVNRATAPNDSDSESYEAGTSNPARGELAYDAMTLQATFSAPAGSTCLAMDYRFFSEEFPEYVGSQFNDTFIAELDTTNWQVVTNSETFDPQINAPADFAAGYGDRISVNDVGPTAVSPTNAAGTTYDAATATITAKTPVTPGPHSVFISIFDISDQIYDSTVFLDNLRFTTEGPGTCRSPDIFQGDSGIDKAGSKVKFGGKTGTLPLACTLPAEATDPCVGSVVVTGKAAGGGNRPLARAKATKVAKGKYSILPATVGEVKLKLTKKGKRLLARTGKAKGTVKVTNSINDVTESFKVKLKGKKKN